MNYDFICPKCKKSQLFENSVMSTDLNTFLCKKCSIKYDIDFWKFRKKWLGEKI